MIPGRPCPSASRRTFAWLLVLTVLLQGNWGCGVFRAPDPPDFEKLEIRAEVERDKKGVLEGDFEAYSTLKGVLVGTVAGLPTAGFTGGSIALGVAFLACSPTLLVYPFCVLGTTIIGAVIGGFVGLVGGGVMGFVGGLPSKTAKEVTEVLTHLEDGRHFEEDLRVAVQQVVPEERQVEGGAEADGVLTARLAKFDLRQHSKDRLSVLLRGSMVQTWKDEDGKQKKNKCKYRYDSVRKPAETWLEAGGVAFGETMTEGFETFARWMKRDLEAFASKTELPRSDDAPRSCYRAPRWYRLY